MDRRSFFKTAGVTTVGGAATVALATPAISQGREKLVMVLSWGRGLAGVFDAAQKVADSINAMSDGLLEVDVKAAGELVGAFEVFDAVTSGQADMYHAPDYYFVGQHPAFAFYTGVPFGMTPTEMNNWYYHMGGMDLHHEIGEIFGLRSFLAGNTGAQAGGWYRKKIKSPEDFKGLKFRMPGLGGKVLGYLGASVQNIPGTEVYQALASGAIDGTEWVGPWADEKMGFQEITKLYYTAGFHEPSASFSTAVNLDRFNSLKPHYQKIIEIASGYTNQWSLTQFLAKNSAALERLQSEGVETLEFPASVWDAFGVGTQKVYAENMGDPLFKKVYDAYQDSMRTSAAWTSVSSTPYRIQRNRILNF